MALRHQLRVLERQVARPQLTQADRTILAAFSRVLPRRAGTAFSSELSFDARPRKIENALCTIPHGGGGSSPVPYFTR